MGLVPIHFGCTYRVVAHHTVTQFVFCGCSSRYVGDSSSRTRIPVTHTRSLPLHTATPRGTLLPTRLDARCAPHAHLYHTAHARSFAIPCPHAALRAPRTPLYSTPRADRHTPTAAAATAAFSLPHRTARTAAPLPFAVPFVPSRRVTPGITVGQHAHSHALHCHTLPVAPPALPAARDAACTGAAHLRVRLPRCHCAHALRGCLYTTAAYARFFAAAAAHFTRRAGEPSSCLAFSSQ